MNFPSCHICGKRFNEHSNYSTRGGNLFKGQFFCSYCIKKLCSKTIDKTLTKDQRLIRFLKRHSRGKILSPSDVFEAGARFSKKLYGRYDETAPIRFSGFDTGMIDGNPIVEKRFDENIKHTDEYLSILKFWKSVGEMKKPFKQNQLEIAILLFISGDKNAITHAKSKNIR